MELIEEQVQAYNDRDLERFLATYSPEAVIEDGEGNVLMRGHADMRERYGKLFASSPALHAVILNRLKVGNYVVDEEEVAGRLGATSVGHAIVVYRVVDDKIVHARILR